MASPITTESHRTSQPDKQAPPPRRRAVAERRWSDRVSETLPVTLHCHGNPPLHARSRNISLGGMFVETVTAIDSLSMPAVISFSLSRGSEIRHYRLSVELIRIADDGAAIMYRDFENETVRTLREMLYAVAGDDMTPDVVHAGHGSQ